MRIDVVLASATDKLLEVSDSPRLDAEILLARALDLPRSYLYAHPDDVLDDAAVTRYFGTIKKRLEGLPLAYITGEREFWSLSITVGPGVLVPRPDTELLVELALRAVPRRASCNLLDLGTGSGAIALAIASERPGCHIVATDASDAALAVARHNAAVHAFCNIEFLQGDWTVPVTGRTFDLIVSNPPYVRSDDPVLEILRFEPRNALVAGGDGLDAIRTLARDCGPLLKQSGLLMLEHGADQGDEVAEILEEHGWIETESHRDLAGHPRVTSSRFGTPAVRHKKTSPA